MNQEDYIELLKRVDNLEEIVNDIDELVDHIHGVHQMHAARFWDIEQRIKALEESGNEL